MTMNRAAPQQFSYHKWPDGQTPTLRFKNRATSTPASLARQLNTRYDFPSPDVSCFSELHRHNPINAPLPCIWDPIHMDYFCYEPETTCFVYAKLGRIHYDPVKKEHYRPDAQQRLTFATSYPEYRVYQSGEVMFWDPRRQDWYQYDMHARRVLWRDQRFWPLPQIFNAPSINSPSRSVTMPASAMVEGTGWQSCDTQLLETRQECPKDRKPRIVEIVPGDSSTSTTTGLKYTLNGTFVERKTAAESARTSKHGNSHIQVSKEVIYETPPRDRNHKHRSARGGVYDLQDLIDKTSSKRRRYSWF